jgi:hypothetical protein
MKTIILGMIAFLFTLTIQAQNKNVKSEVKTTVTTIKDSKGEKKLIKTQEVKEVQKIELKDADSNELNKEIKNTPVQVTAITEVTANGVSNIVDIDRSAYYNLNGQKYQVSLVETGYNMYLPNKEKTIHCVKKLVYLVMFLHFQHDYHLEYNNLLDKPPHIVAHHENLYIQYIFLERYNKYHQK